MSLLGAHIQFLVSAFSSSVIHSWWAHSIRFMSYISACKVGYVLQPRRSTGLSFIFRLPTIILPHEPQLTP